MRFLSLGDRSKCAQKEPETSVITLGVTGVLRNYIRDWHLWNFPCTIQYRYFLNILKNSLKTLSASEGPNNSNFVKLSFRKFANKWRNTFVRRGPVNNVANFRYILNQNDTIQYLTFSIWYFLPIHYRYWYCIVYWYQSLNYINDLLAGTGKSESSTCMTVKDRRCPDHQANSEESQSGCSKS